MPDSASRPQVIGLGEILWDMLPEGRQLGGAPANCVWHAHQLGAESAIFSRVGKDAPGQDIIQTLKKRQLPIDYLQTDDQHPTGYVSVTVDHEGKPEYIIHENVAWDALEATDAWLQKTAHAQAICFGSLAQRSETSRHAIEAILQQAPPDCLRVFDINLRQEYYNRKVIEHSLQNCNILKINDEELPIVMELLELNPETALQEIIRRYGLQMIALTRGSQGSLLRTATEESDHPGIPPENIKDTLGAGDAFTGTLIMGRLAGLPLDAINERANRVASFVCTQDGAMPRLPESIFA